MTEHAQRLPVDPAPLEQVIERALRLLLHFIHTIENDMAKVEAFVFGRVSCSGHLCQKHPSTNTATRCRVNTTSAVRRTPGMGRMWIR